MAEEKVHGSVELRVNPDDQNHTKVFQDSSGVDEQKQQRQRHLQARIL